MQGWVSIHRKIMNNPVWQDPKLLKLWMFCLLEASHKEHEQLVGRQIVKLQPGEFVTGRFALAKAYNEGAKKSDIVPESTLWRWIKWLEKEEFLNIKSNTKFSVITIKNWNLYQQNEQQMDSKWTANDQQMNTNNNGNKGNNEKNKEDDKEHVNPFQFYEQEGFGTISGFTAERIGDLIDDYSEESLIAAMREAVLHGARNLKYVEAILKNPNKNSTERREKNSNAKKTGTANTILDKYDFGTRFG